MPKQSLWYLPVPHNTHNSFLVMYFSVINMWLLSNCFILLQSIPADIFTRLSVFDEPKDS